VWFCGSVIVIVRVVRSLLALIYSLIRNVIYARCVICDTALCLGKGGDDRLIYSVYLTKLAYTSFLSDIKHMHEFACSSLSTAYIMH
jgi:hypothetical protein